MCVCVLRSMGGCKVRMVAVSAVCGCVGASVRESVWGPQAGQKGGGGGGGHSHAHMQMRI